MDHLVEADRKSVIRAYEKRIRNPETDRMVIRERIEKCGTPVAPRGYVRTLDDVFHNPLKVWENRNIKRRQAALKLAFSDQLEHDLNPAFKGQKHHYYSIYYGAFTVELLNWRTRQDSNL